MTNMTGSLTENKSSVHTDESALTLNRYRQKAEILKAEKHKAVNEFNIVFCGVFSSGKTSLINALLNLNLPTGINPVTKMITEIRYGNRFKVTLEADDAKNEISFNSACEIISGKAKPQGEHFTIIIEIPSPLLEKGVIFIDTPGIEDTDKGMDDLTMSALKNAQLAVMCFNPTVLCDMTEKEFLETIQKLTGGNCVFIINCMNYINNLEDIREIEERAKTIFSNFGNSDTVGKGEYFKICSIPGMINFDGFDSWLEYVITYRGEKIKRISRQSSLKFKTGALYDEIESSLSELEASVKIYERENQKSIVPKSKNIDAKIQAIREIKKNHISKIVNVSKKVNEDIDNMRSVEFAEQAGKAINKHSKEYVEKLFKTLEGNSFKAADYNVNKGRYISSALKNAKKVDVQKPVSTKHIRPVYDRIFNGVTSILNGENPINNSSSAKYYYTYNDYRSAAKERFGMYGIPVLREITENVTDDFIYFLENAKDNLVGEYDEKIKYTKYIITELCELQNDIKKEFVLTDKM